MVWVSRWSASVERRGRGRFQGERSVRSWMVRDRGDGKRGSVLNVPYLLTMQKDSYVAFLQKEVPPQQRKPEGLQAAFISAFPIVSHNGFVEMKFLEYNIAKPAFDERECQQRGLTFASAVRALSLIHISEPTRPY